MISFARTCFKLVGLTFVEELDQILDTRDAASGLQIISMKLRLDSTTGVRSMPE